MTQGWDDIKYVAAAWCEDSDWKVRPCGTCPGCAAYEAERVGEMTDRAERLQRADAPAKMPCEARLVDRPRSEPRWTIYICADCGEHQHDHNRDECWKCGSGREWEEIGVVPAVQAPK